MPEITAAPDQRDWGQAVDGIGVLSEKGMWEARAKAAEDAAEKLEDCFDTVATIMQANYLGTGCSEGETLRESVRDSIVREHGWAGALRKQTQELHNLAAECRNAAKQLGDADEQSSGEFNRR
jgi:hypothetical protein